ncbi:hypothetical protein FACS1894133_0620 [Clostridia bacterium]|nr:hypothetical protein FACS1894133_0170 [Clostridia bacterium]GHU57546.1 hypothetical protein FACS1894133_0620 [Clostridia bacterium]
MSEVVLEIGNLASGLPERSQILLLSMLQRLAGYDEDDIYTVDDMEAHYQALEDRKNGECITREELVKKYGLDTTEEDEVPLKQPA